MWVVTADLLARGRSVTLTHHVAATRRRNQAETLWLFLGRVRSHRMQLPLRRSGAESSFKANGHR